jgi:hypothetical protein
MISDVTWWDLDGSLTTRNGRTEPNCGVLCDQLRGGNAIQYPTLRGGLMPGVKGSERTVQNGDSQSENRLWEQSEKASSLGNAPLFLRAITNMALAWVFGVC